MDGVGKGGPASGMFGVVSGTPSTQPPGGHSSIVADDTVVLGIGGDTIIVELKVTHPDGGHSGCVIVGQ